MAEVLVLELLAEAWVNVLSISIDCFSMQIFSSCLGERARSKLDGGGPQQYSRLPEIQSDTTIFSVARIMRCS